MEQKAKVIKITVKTIVDDNPDLSYLETDADYHYGKDGNNWSHVSEEDKQKVIAQYGSIYAACEAYAKADRERLEKYSDTWNMLGIIAEAEIHVPCDTIPSSWIIQHITSGGLWGIESDSGKEYLEEIRNEQITELKKYLKILNCDGIEQAEIESEDEF